jgi:6-phosphogluconolactonase
MDAVRDSLNLSRLVICDDPEDLSHRAASAFCKIAQKVVLSGRRLSLVLSGGNTPGKLYELLSDASKPFFQQIDWQAVDFFWGDERWVPEDHSDSNYKMAFNAMLSRLPIQSSQIFRIPTDLASPESAAKQYDKTIRWYFDRHYPAHGCFDVIFLGLGGDGHIASLFPGSRALRLRNRWTASVIKPADRSQRITLTLPIINRAENVVFFVTGKDKAPVAAEVLKASGNKPLLPAARVRPLQGNLTWFLDKDAASRLNL